MKKSLLAALNDTERLLVGEAAGAELDLLDEDAVVELHGRIRRARDKYTDQYRRGAIARVLSEGGRGSTRPADQRAALKAEAFEEALSRVSRRLAVLARQTANELREERLAAARSDGNPRPDRKNRSRKSASTPKAGAGAGPKRGKASTRALGAKRRAKRDRRNSS